MSAKALATFVVSWAVSFTYAPSRVISNIIFRATPITGCTGHVICTFGIYFTGITEWEYTFFQWIGNPKCTTSNRLSDCILCCTAS